MAQFTKKAIIASFLKLLNENSFDKITVKDISEDCGVNRNTFYYYFQDIFALLEEVFDEELKRVLSDTPDFRSWQEAFIQSAHFAFENKRAMYHLYNSNCRDYIDKYIYKIADYIMYGVVEYLSEGLDVSDEDKHMVSDFYKHALIGLVFSWLDHGMETDPEDYIRRLGSLLDGNIRFTLEKTSPKNKLSN